MKIATIIGARPQFIKAAMVSRAIGHVHGLEETILHTGQHYDDNMSLIFFEELGIPHPHRNLGIGSGSHGAQTGQMLAAIEAVLLEIQPQCVLVYGDTNSTLAGALAAAKLHVPVAHVEAGLRSFNRYMPEEINRVVTDHCSDLLFAPTKTAVQNLCHEGIPSDRIFQVGDVMYDAALHYGAAAESQSRAMQTLGLTDKGYLLATVHRAENTDDADRLHIILQALAEVASELPVVIPLHPRTRNILRASAPLSRLAEALCLVDPVGYLDMIMLEKHARLIATDSGGIQKEAFFHQVPCVTLRHETEWVELVELGWNHLAPPVSVGSVVAEITRGLRSAPSLGESPYGDGKSAEQIAEALLGRLEHEVHSFAGSNS
jgi:UDP-GlcNAc3NAcA epimerase